MRRCNRNFLFLNDVLVDKNRIIYLSSYHIIIYLFMSPPWKVWIHQIGKVSISVYLQMCICIYTIINLSKNTSKSRKLKIKYKVLVYVPHATKRWTLQYVRTSNSKEFYENQQHNTGRGHGKTNINHGITQSTWNFQWEL